MIVTWKMEKAGNQLAFCQKRTDLRIHLNDTRRSHDMVSELQILILRLFYNALDLIIIRLLFYLMYNSCVQVKKTCVMYKRIASYCMHRHVLMTWYNDYTLQLNLTTRDLEFNSLRLCHERANYFLLADKSGVILFYTL